MFYFYVDLMKAIDMKKNMYIKGIQNFTFGKKVDDSQLPMTVLDFVCGSSARPQWCQAPFLNQAKQERHILLSFLLFF